MPDLINELRDAGFADDEIAAWSTKTRVQLSSAGFNDEEIDDDFGQPKTPKGVDPVAVAELRALPAPLAAGVCGHGHPLGRQRIERRAARARTLHALRPQGRDDPASGVGRFRRRLFAVADRAHFDVTVVWHTARPLDEKGT
jgi:hypothetical protein